MCRHGRPQEPIKVQNYLIEPTEEYLKVLHLNIRTLEPLQSAEALEERLEPPPVPLQHPVLSHCIVSSGHPGTRTYRTFKEKNHETLKDL